MAERFQCSAVTPEQKVYEAEVTYANLPAHDGQLGVMANHAPLLTELGAGTLELESAKGQTDRFDISGGFAQVNNNALILLCEKARPHGEQEPAEPAQA